MWSNLSSMALLLLLLSLLLLLLLPPTFSFPHQMARRHHAPKRGNFKIGLTKRCGKCFSENLGHPRNDQAELKCMESPRRERPLGSLLLPMAACFGCVFGFPQLTNAEWYHPGYDNHDYVVLEQPWTTSTKTTTTSPTPFLVATYASQGSGGLPFLSPFQTPGAVPQPMDPKYDDKEARNRAYDEALDRDQKERDAYYAKMALQAREQKAKDALRRRQELGLDVEDAGPRFGDEKVADLKSLKRFLLEQEQAPVQQQDPSSTE